MDARTLSDEAGSDAVDSVDTSRHQHIMFCGTVVLGMLSCKICKLSCKYSSAQCPLLSLCHSITHTSHASSLCTCSSFVPMCHGNRYTNKLATRCRGIAGPACAPRQTWSPPPLVGHAAGCVRTPRTWRLRPASGAPAAQAPDPGWHMQKECPRQTLRAYFRCLQRK